MPPTLLRFKKAEMPKKKERRWETNTPPSWVVINSDNEDFCKLYLKQSLFLNGPFCTYKNK